MSATAAAASSAAGSTPAASFPTASPPPPTGDLHVTLIVIGKVTHDTARVLIEVLEGGSVTCHLTKVKSRVRTRKGNAPDPTVVQDEAAVLRAAEVVQSPHSIDSEVVSVTQDLLPGRPRIFKFEGLEQNARYALSFDNLAHAQPASSFVTMIKNWKVGGDYPPMHFAAISCNMVSVSADLKNGQTDLWQDLADRIGRGEVDYILHMGDQVYADEPRSNTHTAPIVSAFAPDSHAEHGEGLTHLEARDQLVFKKCTILIQKSGAKTPEEFIKLHPQIEELYRQIYRETWSHPPTAKALANCPSLSIYDDHDFVDNWGTLAIHHDKDSAEYSVGLCARQVYYEYQAALHRDFELEKVPEIVDDHHFHVFGETGVIFTESRGAQSFRYETDKDVPFLGVRQWADLEAAMAEDGLFKDVKHLVLVCPCPVVYLPHTLNAFMEPMVEDAQGHWAAKPFIAEQTRMLNLCLAWQEGRDAAEYFKNTEPAEKELSYLEPVQERGAYRTSYPSLAGGPVKNAKTGTMEATPLKTDRRVTLLGGDVHVGGHTRIFKHGHLVLEQLVSSAMANHLLPTFAFKIASMIQNAYTKLEDGWEFNHQPFTRVRNYGLVDASSPSEGTKCSVTTHIIFAD